MLDKQFFEELSQRLTTLLPMAEELRDEARTRIEQQLQHSLKKLDLVSREEFDAQGRALERAEKRLAELEAVIEKLEKELS